MAAQIRIPKKFYDDHVERDLPAPEIIRSTASHYWIENTDPAMAELTDDANHYANDGTDADAWIVFAARALVKAIKTGAAS
jgi:hypothetical protein